MSIDSTSSRPAPNLANRDLLDVNYAGDRREDYFRYGAPLYEASIKGDWKSAKAILDKKSELVRYSLTQHGETALHVAASANRSKQVVEFVKNLVNLMTTEDLELQNKNYDTALYLAAAAGNLETVKIMMAKNEILHTIPGGGGILMPLYAAVMYGSYEVVKYLYDNSKGLRDDGWTEQNRRWLLGKCVQSDMFVCAFIGLKVEMPEKESQALQLLKILWEDIVKLPRQEIDDILRGRPDLMEPAKGWVLQAIQLKELISEQLEEMEKTYKNERQVPQLKKIVSRYVLKMHTETQNIIKEENRTRSGDQALELEKIISENIVKLHDDTQKFIKQKAEVKAQQEAEVKALQEAEVKAQQEAEVKALQEAEVKALQEAEVKALQEAEVKALHGLISNHITVMRRKSSLWETYSSSLRETYSSRVLFIAAEMGNTNFIVELILRYPDLIWEVNDQNQSIFHVAVKHRHVGIYNLLYEIGTMKDMITPLKDKNDNNMLHLVGKTVNRKQLENVSGVALEMQRELLWFQEVESMIPPSIRERRNSDGLTPHELFTKEHKDMVIQGERWMKEIAGQCMVVAALIATMVFAAAFTVPGGYDQNNGIPIFHSKTTFKVFVVANAISLFSSSASILYMFLSVFTSRYAERDFLVSLPKKLIIGLSYLFLSMTTMIIAFSVSFFVLYQKGLLWIPILISLFALIPFGIYIKAQYILFLDVFRSTYRSKNIFKPKKPVLYYKNPTV